MASCSSVLAKETLPPITAPIMYTNHVKRPEHMTIMTPLLLVVGINKVLFSIVVYAGLTLLHGSIHAAGIWLKELLVGLRWLVEQLDEQGAGFLVFAAADSGQLIQLLLHQTGVIQRILHPVPQHTQTQTLTQLNPSSTSIQNFHLFTGSSCHL